LPLLLGLVIGGIAGIAVLLHVLGYSRRATLDDAETARAVWDDAYPATPARSAWLTADRTAAVVQTAQGPGIVWAMGSDFAARALLPGHYAVLSDAGGITIKTHDLTAPKITLSLDQADRAACSALLQGATP
jgi:hypothetical protein